MQLARAGVGKDSRCIAAGDVAARHDDETAGGALDQSADQRRSLEHARLLPRGEKAVDAELHEGIKRRDRITRDVEGAVEGDG